MPTTAVVLLRALNVGGRNKLPMAQLRSVLTAAGFHDVRTYIQSGNAVLLSDDADAAVIASRVHAALLTAAGVDIGVVVRTRDELATLVAGNPFLAAGHPAEHLHLICCGASAPALGDLPAYDGQSAVAIGPDVYALLPHGVGRDKFALALGKRIGTNATMRNWRTVLALLALANETGRYGSG